MIKKELFVSILLGALLGVGAVYIGLVPGIDAANAQVTVANIPVYQGQVLTEDSSVEDILALMLDSHKMWTTLQAQTLYQVKDQSGNDLAHFVNQDFWLVNDGKSRLEIHYPDEIPFLIWVSDGTNIIEQDTDKEQYYTQPVPSAFKSTESLDPRSAPVDNSNTIYVNHPFALIQSSLKDWLVPSGIAQALFLDLQHPDRDVKIIGTDSIVGREVLVLLRIPKRHMYWVDIETGVILRAEYLNREGDEVSDDWIMRFEVVSIQYDVALNQDLFSTLPNPEFNEVSSFEFHEGFPEEQLEDNLLVP